MADNPEAFSGKLVTRRTTLGLLAGGTVGLLSGCGGADAVPEAGDGGSGGSAGNLGSGGTAGDAGTGGNAGADGGLSCRASGPTPGCRITDDNILGPYYKENAPLKSDLAKDVTLGTILFVSGTVFGCDCVTPLAGAVVDIWQADDAGAYDAVGFALRGRMTTDASGGYAFRTVLPGWYLNGSTYRPRHIHYKVSHADGTALTTQLYFQGDPHIATDAFVRESLIMPLLEESAPDGGRLFRVRFDIVLA